MVTNATVLDTIKQNGVTPKFIADYDKDYYIFGVEDTIKDNIQSAYFCVNKSNGEILNFIPSDFNKFFDAITNRAINVK